MIALHQTDATTVSPRDEVFAALDQQRVGDQAAGWRIYVQGVHSIGRDLWVQISRNNDPADTVVVHLVPEASACDVVAALHRVSGNARTARVVKAAPGRQA